jgi:hypothetical protein
MNTHRFLVAKASGCLDKTADSRKWRVRSRRVKEGLVVSLKLCPFLGKQSNIKKYQIFLGKKFDPFCSLDIR